MNIICESLNLPLNLYSVHHHWSQDSYLAYVFLEGTQFICYAEYYVKFMIS